MNSFDDCFKYALELVELPIENITTTSVDKWPKNAALRRSLSNCYYAIFHLTTVGGSFALFDAKDVAMIASRAFEHRSLETAYKKLSYDNINNRDHKLGKLFRNSPEEAKELISKKLAGTYNDLLTLRRDSDYDFSDEAIPEYLDKPDKVYERILSAVDYIFDLQELKEKYPDDFKRLIAIFLFRKIALPLKG